MSAWPPAYSMPLCLMVLGQRRSCGVLRGRLCSSGACSADKQTPSDWRAAAVAQHPAKLQFFTCMCGQTDTGYS